MTHSQYNVWALEERIRQWHDEADRASSEAIRRICLDEANDCERQRQRSLSTPVLKQRSDVGGPER